MRVFLLVLILITGCARKGDDAVSTAATKSIFSKWTRSSDGFWFDLTGTQFNFTYYGNHLIFTGGAQCDCDLTIGGSDSSGTITLASCSYHYGSGSGTNPGCGTLNQVASFTKTGNKLQVCGSSCGDYQ